jgi:5-methyltetrahydrofolate--homocysteine methyltransferase
VGGAALSNRFTRLRIAPEYDGLVAYAQDAMSGLALANTLQDADERQKLASDIEAETDELIRSAQARESAEASATTSDVAPAQVRHD